MREAWRWLNRTRPLYVQRRILDWEFPAIRRKHIFTGAMGMTYYYLISGLFFAPFVRGLGASKAAYGAMVSACMGAVGIQIFSAILTHRLGHRKILWLTSALLERGVRGLGMAAGFWLWMNGLPGAVWVLISGLVLADFLAAMASPPWLSWLADLVPSGQHASFLGRRQAWQALAAIVTLVPAAYYVDGLSGDMKVTGRMFVFAFGTFLGLLDLVIHRTIPEPFMARSEDGHRLSSMLEPLRDRRFRPWLWFQGTWSFSTMFVGSTLMLYFAENLKLQDDMVRGTCVIVIFPLVLTMAVSNLAGKWIDRFGVRRALYACHTGWALLPILWVLTTPANALVLLAVTQTLGSTWSNLASLAANKVTTRVPPDGSRAMYIAVTALVASVGAALGGWAGAGVTGAAETWSGDALGFHWIGYHVVLLLSLGMRLGSLLLIRAVPEPGREAADGPAGDGLAAAGLTGVPAASGRTR